MASESLKEETQSSLYNIKPTKPAQSVLRYAFALIQFETIFDHA